MRTYVSIFAAVVVLFASGCQPSVDIDKERKALLATDSEWMHSANDASKFASYYTLRAGDYFKKHAELLDPIYDTFETDKIEVEYPVGHRRRRAEGTPLLIQKFKTNAATRFPAERVEKIISIFADSAHLKKTPVQEFVELFV